MKAVATKSWILAAWLTTPMALFFGSYLFYHPADLIPTGFIQYDNPGYVAYAKQYLDADTFSIFYSNPFNDSGNYPSIYFQVQSLFLALALKTGIPAGALLIPFTLICSFFCFRVLIALFDHLVPKPRYRTLCIVLFAWGGGLIVAGSTIYNLFAGQNPWNSLFILDPANGWWGLNLGRSLFFSCEAYYHLLFLLTIFCIVKRKWLPALLVAVLLSLSHPFTGVELLSIVCTWLFAEKILARNKEIPWFFAITNIALLAFHAWYYLYYLAGYADHRSVNEQYALNWYLRWEYILPAYAITGLLAVATMLRLKITFFRSMENRLFLCWFIIALLLAKHELFMKPMQPIHFTRGYIWTSLFLIGIPALQSWLGQLSTYRLKHIILGIFASIFLLDNGMWVIKYASSPVKSTSVTYLTQEEKNILEILKKNTTSKTLIIGNSSEENILPYLATVYTPAYSWLSHPYTTPFVQQKQDAYARFITDGTLDTAWTNRELIFIFDKKDEPELNRSLSLPFPFEILIETVSYKVIAIKLE